MKKNAKCHPHLKESAKGLCSTCYNKSLWKEFPEKRQRHLENRRKRSKESYKYSPFSSRDDKLKHRYGITSDEYNEMLEKQNGVCAICEEEFHRALYVDHNHKTGKVRALLCARCNSGVGYLEKGPDMFEKMKQYIEKHNATD